MTLSFLFLMFHYFHRLIGQMAIAHNRERALQTLAIIDPILNSTPVSKQQLRATVRDTGNSYNWSFGTPPEFDAALGYLHGINALHHSLDGRYTRDKLTDYWLRKI